MARFEDASIKTYTSLSWLNAGQALIFTLGLTATMVMCAFGIRSGTNTVGDFVMINAMMIQLYVPLNFMGMVYREIKQAVTDIETMFSILGRDPEIKDKPDAVPLHAAAGPGYATGFAGNSHHVAPAGMLPAVMYLVDELGADVNAVDADGNSIVHLAASRGDTEMIKFLVSKGADVKKVNRAGQTTIDVANGPVQRTRPYPETIKYLEGLGAINNHKCLTC